MDPNPQNLIVSSDKTNSIIHCFQFLLNRFDLLVIIFLQISLEIYEPERSEILRFLQNKLHLKVRHSTETRLIPDEPVFSNPLPSNISDDADVIIEEEFPVDGNGNKIFLDSDDEMNDDDRYSVIISSSMRGQKTSNAECDEGILKKAASLETISSMSDLQKPRLELFTSTPQVSDDDSADSFKQLKVHAHDVAEMEFGWMNKDGRIFMFIKRTPDLEVCHCII